jgi:hypothetical protein
VTTASVTLVALVENVTASGGVASLTGPYAVVYTALGGDGKYHVYGARLDNTAVAPTPTQISNISFPAGGNALDSSCFHHGYQNAFQPASSFLVVELPTANICGIATTANAFVLINFTDSAATAPVTLPASIKTLQITEVGNTATGAMTGLVLVDASGNLNFYPASGFPNFAGAATIKAGVTSKGHRAVQADRTGHVLAGGSLVFTEVADGSGNNLIYRIDSAGSGTQVYTTTGTIDGLSIGDAVNDNSNLYFYDASGPSGAYTAYKFVKLPISGAAATTLYTDSAPAGKTYSLVDVDSQVLIIKSNSVSPPTPSIALLTLSTAGGVPATLVSAATATVFNLEAFLDFASDHLFVNTYSHTAAPSSAVYTPPTAAVISGQGGAGTAFAPFAVGFRLPLASGQATVLEFTNLTVPYPALSGGSLFAVNAGTFASTQVTLALGGGNYVVPTGDSVVAIPLNPTIGVGVALGASGNSIGLGLDVARAKILTIAPANTSVMPL